MMMTKKAEYISIDFKTLEQYRTFESIKEMDGRIYEYIEILRQDDVPQSVIELLLFYGRSSLRVIGVSFARNETIGISKRTVVRASQTLEKYGMIEKVKTVKKWRKSVNVIQKKQEMAPQSVTTEKDGQVALVKAKTVEIEKEPPVYKHSLNNYLLDTAKAVKNAIPAPIYDTLGPFFNAKDLQRITGVIFRGKAHKHVKIRIEDHAEKFKAVFLDVIRRYKQGTIRSLDGYLYTSVKRLTRRLFLAI